MLTVQLDGWIKRKKEKKNSKLSEKGYTLRSGGADGADSAFEKGAKKKEVFYANDCTNDAMSTVDIYHPAPDRLSNYAKKLMGRNAMQILGKDLNSPVAFVVCWTPDGCISDDERSISTGGTGQAISIASKNNIPVFNLQRKDHLKRIEEFIK